MRYRSTTSLAVTLCPLSWMLVHAYSISFARYSLRITQKYTTLVRMRSGLHMNRHPCQRSGSDELPPIAHNNSSFQVYHMVNRKPLPNCYHTMQTSTFKKHLTYNIFQFLNIFSFKCIHTSCCVMCLLGVKVVSENSHEK